MREGNVEKKVQRIFGTHKNGYQCSVLCEYNVANMHVRILVVHMCDVVFNLAWKIDSLVSSGGQQPLSGFVSLLGRVRFVEIGWICRVLLYRLWKIVGNLTPPHFEHFVRLVNTFSYRHEVILQSSLLSLFTVSISVSFRIITPLVYHYYHLFI